MAPVSSILSELRQKTASEQATVLVVALLFALFVRIITILAFGNLRRLPGPFSSRLTGLPLSIAAFKGRRAQWLYELHKQYGPVVRVAPGEVSVADSTHYRTIYSNPKASHKDPSFYGAASFTGLDNIFQMTSREQHAARRKLVAAPYSPQSMHKLEHIIRSKSRLLADRFLSDAAASRRGTVDAYELCALFSFELVCAAGFAKDFSSRSSALSVLRAMETSGPRFIFNAIFPPLKDASWSHKMPGRAGATYRAHNYWHECSRQMVREYLDRKDSEDIQDYLLAPFRDGVDGWLGRQLSEAEFVEEAMGIMLAGSGTTSSTLTYLIYAISQPQNQHVQDHLREEVLALSGTDDLAELRGAPYMNAVIKETLRLYPTIISTLPRILDQPIYINGMELPPGVVVGMQNYVHHRDPIIFPAPEAFRPERWLESSDLEGMEAALSKSLAIYSSTIMLILYKLLLVWDGEIALGRTWHGVSYISGSARFSGWLDCLCPAR